MRFTWAYLSSLSKSVWMASCPSGVSSAPPNLVSSIDVLRVHSIPLSLSLMKMLNSIGPCTDPRGTPLVTSLHLDIDPLTTTLWMWPSNQFLIHRTVHPSNLYFPNLQRQWCCGGPCLRLYRWAGRWHSFLFRCPLMQSLYQRKPLVWSGRTSFSEAVLAALNHLPVLHVP